MIVLQSLLLPAQPQACVRCCALMVGLRCRAAVVPRGQSTIAGVTRACFSAGLIMRRNISPIGTTEPSALIKNSDSWILAPRVGSEFSPNSKLKIQNSKPKIHTPFNVYSRLFTAINAYSSPLPPPGGVFSAWMEDVGLETVQFCRTLSNLVPASQGFSEKKLNRLNRN